MRLRQLPLQEAPPEISKAQSFTKTFEVELITPLYGGGVEAGHPDSEMPIRASAIRGQLRFWWRLLNPRRTLQDETEIWGGISEKEATASKVILRIKNMPKSETTKKISCADYQRENNQLWKKGAGYVLGIQNDLNSTFLLVSKGEKKITFELELRIVATTEGERQHIWDHSVFPALRWWASFGGLGARTRRGLGSVKIANLEPVTDEEADKFDCKLVKLTVGRDATSAWTTAISKLQKFRQGTEVGEGRNPGKDKPSRSRWPEADSIRQITGCSLPRHSTPIVPATAIPSFPRAVFGLPIITHFNSNQEPADTTLKPKFNGKIEERMASPLILKAMWTGKDYQPIALLLPHAHTTEMGLHLEGNGSNLHKDMPTVDDWWSNTSRTVMTSNPNNPLSRRTGVSRTGDVLQDFLNFFQGK